MHNNTGYFLKTICHISLFSNYYFYGSPYAALYLNEKKVYGLDDAYAHKVLI